MVVACALALCNVLYTLIAMACLVAFGGDLDDNVLNNLSIENMAPLIGACVCVRVLGLHMCVWLPCVYLCVHRCVCVNVCLCMCESMCSMCVCLEMAGMTMHNLSSVAHWCVYGCLDCRILCVWSDLITTSVYGPYVCVCAW